MPNKPIYTVSTLNAESAALLAAHFGFIYVTGEISNLSKPSSGHLYFSLKDPSAQVRCALFRFQHQQVNFTLENGQEVIVQAKVSLYEPRGDFQLIVTSVQLAGAGKLQIAFEKLKKELEKQGLFLDENKKPLPYIPKCIGIITSATAAALQDILKVLKKRFPTIPVIIYPTQVQGSLAAGQIVNAIALANTHKKCDVLILARGGGSIEDLWPFNEAMVAYAIFESAIPIITGIGHQTDFTIADFVADFRAPTPSSAAEHTTPDCTELLEQLNHFYQRLFQLISSQLKAYKTHLAHLQKRLKHPGEKIRLQAQQLDQLENNLRRIMQFYLQKTQEKVAHCAHMLETLSPLKILQRGYSITRHKLSNKVITRYDEVVTGDSIVTRLADGEIESIILGKRHGKQC
ncbi:MAG: exodeoxyribonuclease VII large subunit [Gammaproteobacteria bacterium RIFCSPHIGHO2_12_FULL_38_11]|nr:MAG: exodeoxyribonuclease VII large subunit [Gammaproteobacteria bacterium RIFCSPHIGHO2_12_FULL_38_11]